MTRQSTVDLLPIPSWFVEPTTGRVVAINRPALRWLGVEAADVIDQRDEWEARICNDSFRRGLADYLADGPDNEHYRGTLVWRRPSGEKAKSRVVCWWTSDGLVQGQTFPVLPPADKPRRDLGWAIWAGLALLAIWEALQWIIAL